MKSLSDPKAGQPRFIAPLGRIATAVAVLIALALPAGYFLLGRQSAVAALDTEVSISAGLITQAINENPELWRFEGHRLAFMLQNRLGVSWPETRRILDPRGKLIEEHRESVPPPVVTRRATLYESGRPVALIEITRTMRPLALGTGLVALLGVLIGWAIHAILMILLRELKRALGSLSDEKERSHVTLHAIGEGVISTGPDGRVLLMNAVAERLTGWTASEAEGRPLGEVFQTVDARTGDPLPDRMKRFREKESLEILASYALQTSRTGQMRRIADSAAPIRGEIGDLQGMVVVFRDITEQQRIEDELLKAQKLESVGVLAGGIAHDFNNILMAILGNISLAMEQVDPQSPARKRMAEAGKACQRARDLTSQLLTFSRGGAPVRKTGSIGALVRESAGFAVVGGRARCEIDVPDDLWPVEMDEGQIGQVVHNLVINADQAMPGGGTIFIRAENAMLRASDPLPLAPGRYVRVSIRDEGPGIRPEHLANIFDPYFTTKREGSGLGLSVCFNVVKNHGGHITVSSGAGLGAAFDFYLPASAKADADASPEEPGPAAGAGRVLVMDDDEVILEVAGEMLRHLSFEPAFAKDGVEAIASYKEAIASGRPFAAVIMDLTIPGGMGGREAVRRLLEIDPGARVIVSSGYSNDPLMADFRAHGFCGVVAKPYLIGTLSSVLTEVIAQGAGGAPAA